MITLKVRMSAKYKSFCSQHAHAINITSQIKYMMKIKTVNPVTGTLLKEYQEYNDTKVEKIIGSVHRHTPSWQETTIRQRADLLVSLADNLISNQEHLATTITQEMGKPIKQANDEIKKCAKLCRYYAKYGGKFLDDKTYKSDASESYVKYSPLGTILGVMPWNYPFWQVFRFAVPTLLAGNTILLKHASNVTKCAITIEKLFAESGFAKDVFRILIISGKRTEKLLDDYRIHAVSLTGSEHAGSRVALTAGRNIKKTVLELGGSDPFIVLEDADLDKAANTAITARFQNTGQSCIAAKRFILHSKIAGDFLDIFTHKTNELLIGDPLDDRNSLGPIARDDLRKTLHKQVINTIEEGAKLITGGSPTKGKGYFYPATVLDHVKPGMTAYKEETFGPVASIIRVRSHKQAIQVANDTKYGLASSVWTNNIDTANQFASSIHAGAIFINEMVKSDPRLPFGGIKTSGYGRELSDFGIKEFANAKTVYIK